MTHEELVDVLENFRRRCAAEAIKETNSARAALDAKGAQAAGNVEKRIREIDIKAWITANLEELAGGRT